MATNTTKQSVAAGGAVDLAKAIASIFGFAGFTVSTTSAFLAGSDAQHALADALVALVVCYIVGTICGSVVVRVIVEHNEEYEKANPIPEVNILKLDDPEPAQAPAPNTAPADTSVEGRGEPAKKL